MTMRTKGVSRERQLSYQAVADLKPDLQNPRKHPRAQIQALARSIQAFGFNAPVLADNQGKVIAGHGRLEAAKSLGIDLVPVISLDDLSEAQAKAYMLADNKLTDRSSWDDKRLGAHLKALSEMPFEFELEDTGFETPEIDLRIQGMDTDPEADQTDEFKLANGPVVSRFDDLWHLGGHRIYCGDALNIASYRRLLGEEKAASVFTDPPYNVKIDGHVSGLGTTTHREFAMASGEMAPADFQDFLRTALGLAGSFSRPGALIYVCMDWRHLGEILGACQSLALSLLNLCVWVKTNGGMGSLYRSQHELVLVLKKCGEQHRNNIQLGRFGRNRSNVWTYPGANSFARKGKDRALGLHPTIKPIALIADALLDSTAPKDIVLDPFVGSGTTILAAEKTGRRGYGIEIDPVYVDTVIDRWQRMTGHKATLSSGGTFAEMTAARAGQ